MKLERRGCYMRWQSHGSGSSYGNRVVSDGVLRGGGEHNRLDLHWSLDHWLGRIPILRAETQTPLRGL